MGRLKSFRDLNVYQRLKALHLDLHLETLGFPKFELYELGSQMRRSSNSAPALIAEGWGSRHTNMYIEAINRALGESRETQHHLDVAKGKQYLSEQRFVELDSAYDECGRMLEGLHRALSHWQGSTRTGTVVKERPIMYGSDVIEDDPVFQWTAQYDDAFPWSTSHLTPNLYHPTPAT